MQMAMCIICERDYEKGKHRTWYKTIDSYVAWLPSSMMENAQLINFVSQVFKSPTEMMANTEI